MNTSPSFAFAGAGDSALFERLHTRVCASAEAACEEVAAEIVALVRTRAAEGRPAVLGLATGSTPVPLYRRLIRAHREEGLSFRHVITFNLDEYCGLGREHTESYWQFMRRQFFDHVDLAPENTHLPDGLVARESVHAHCRAYEQAIRDAGGIDLQVLGIGRTGHVGFNEPGSSPDSRTRQVTLDPLTRRDAARDFQGEANVPRQAITMGLRTILEARRVVLLAWGGGKAEIVAKAVEGPATTAVPASLLQAHPNLTCWVDQAAGAELTRHKHPWLVANPAWDEPLVRRAVIWLAHKCGKPILKLRESDYTENGLADLLTERGAAYQLNLVVFNSLQRGVTGWPGGKPDADDRYRPERALPAVKRCLVLSAEPLQAELGMGGTIQRLVKQGHQVRVAHLASGGLAVSDRDAREAWAFCRSVLAEETRGTAAALDVAGLRRIKRLMRRAEARAALEALGLAAEQCEFLDLPFYEKGGYRCFETGEADVASLRELLMRFQPQQIFATGADADPSSVEAKAWEIVRAALVRVASEPWMAECRVWLFGQADRPIPSHDIDMVVPLSPQELEEKLAAIYRFSSQRRQAPTDQSVEAWDQAYSLGRGLATEYDKLGLADYEAMEVFKRLRG